MKTLAGIAIGAGLLALAWQGPKTANFARVTPEQLEILSHMSIVYLEDGQGGQAKTVRLTGVNVQLVNGTGLTRATNGTGNLIVGYNELGNDFGDDRTGSHCVVIGGENTYSSYGGIVAGSENRITGMFSSVPGGKRNWAIGSWSSVTGGQNNWAQGYTSSVSGGGGGIASGHTSSISGGEGATAQGYSSSVSGGEYRSALGEHDWVGGGMVEDY